MKHLDALKVELTERESTANRLIDEHKTALSGVTGLSEDEAKERFFEIIRNEFSMEASQLGKGIIEEVKERAEEDARRLIGSRFSDTLGSTLTNRPPPRFH